MARINLLPWRAELRKQHQKTFLTYLAFAAVFGVVVMYAVHIYMEGIIATKKQRNDFLTNKIAIVEKKIAEIKKLDKKREELIKSIDLIQDLQQSRPQVVRLFDTIPSVIPDGLHLKRLERKGSKLFIEGSSESNTRIASFLRNIDASEWLGGADLSEFNQDSDSIIPSNEFSVTALVKMNKPKPKEGEQ